MIGSMCKENASFFGNYILKSPKRGGLGRLLAIWWRWVRGPLSERNRRKGWGRVFILPRILGFWGNNLPRAAIYLVFVVVFPPSYGSKYPQHLMRPSFHGEPSPKCFSKGPIQDIALKENTVSFTQCPVVFPSIPVCDGTRTKEVVFKLIARLVTTLHDKTDLVIGKTLHGWYGDREGSFLPPSFQAIRHYYGRAGACIAESIPYFPSLFSLFGFDPTSRCTFDVHGSAFGIYVSRETSHSPKNGRHGGYCSDEARKITYAHNAKEPIVYMVVAAGIFIIVSLIFQRAQQQGDGSN